MRSPNKHVLLPFIIFAIVWLIGTAGDWSPWVRLAVAGLLAAMIGASSIMVRDTHLREGHHH